MVSVEKKIMRGRERWTERLCYGVWAQKASVETSEGEMGEGEQVLWISGSRKCPTLAHFALDWGKRAPCQLKIS